MIEFKLPELGENIEQGDLVRLMVAPGATVIVWSALGMLWAASPPVACAVIAAILVFYLFLSVPLAFGMLEVLAGMAWARRRLSAPVAHATPATTTT